MKRVLFRPAAAKELEKLQTRDRELVEAAVERFARTGQGDVKMLAGQDRHMRLRAGDWRIRFIYDHPDAIRILHIHNRREAYRQIEEKPGQASRSVTRRAEHAAPQEAFDNQGNGTTTLTGS